MIEKRRVRRRSLIRSSAFIPARANFLSSKDGVADHPMGPSGMEHTTPISNFAVPNSDPKMFLRQLSSLHAAGILTDEEFSAASLRLIGS